MPLYHNPSTYTTFFIVSTNLGIASSSSLATLLSTLSVTGFTPGLTTGTLMILNLFTFTHSVFSFHFFHMV
jgi:hypothetical protein